MAHYTRKLVNDYCVLDFETTGLMFEYSEPIEIAIVKVRDSVIVDNYSTLIKPKEEIDDFITELTGISNEMVKDAPIISDIRNDVLNFIGADIIVGHNTGFDIGFFTRNIGTIENEYIDTVQFARKIYPDLPNHKLSTIKKYLNIDLKSHRALADCETTYALYEDIKNKMLINHLQISDIFAMRKNHKQISVKNLVFDQSKNDITNMFFEKYCVFTGTFITIDGHTIQRKELFQLLGDIGGFPQDQINKLTNYLIVGDYSRVKSVIDNKTSKIKKAQEYKLKGQEIEIIDDKTFEVLIGIKGETYGNKR